MSEPTIDELSAQIGAALQRVKTRLELCAGAWLEAPVWTADAPWLERRASELDTCERMLGTFLYRTAALFMAPMDPVDALDKATSAPPAPLAHPSAAAAAEQEYHEEPGTRWGRERSNDLYRRGKKVGIVTPEMFLGELASIFGHDAPWSDDEFDAFEIHIGRMEQLAREAAAKVKPAGAKLATTGKTAGKATSEPDLKTAPIPTGGRH